MRILMLLLLCLQLSVQATELELKLVLDKSAASPAQVQVSGRADKATWLGISFYPYETANVLTDGEHQVLQVPAGRFSFTFDVGDRFVNGGVECALWQDKILLNDCSGPCEWCLINGYHLDHRIAYLYGSLATSTAGEKN